VNISPMDGLQSHDLVTKSRPKNGDATKGTRKTPPAHGLNRRGGKKVRPGPAWGLWREVKRQGTEDDNGKRFLGSTQKPEPPQKAIEPW